MTNEQKNEKTFSAEPPPSAGRREQAERLDKARRSAMDLFREAGISPASPDDHSDQFAITELEFLEILQQFQDALLAAGVAALEETPPPATGKGEQSDEMDEEVANHCEVHHGTSYPLTLRCAWCNESIEPYGKHVHNYGYWQSEKQDWRMHEECYTVADLDGALDAGFTLYDHERPEASPETPPSAYGLSRSMNKRLETMGAPLPEGYALNEAKDLIETPPSAPPQEKTMRAATTRESIAPLTNATTTEKGSDK